MDTTKRGRKRRSPHEAGVVVILPSDLLEAIDRYAANQFGAGRALAIPELIACGLYARAGLPPHLEWMVPWSEHITPPVPWERWEDHPLYNDGGER